MGSAENRDARIAVLAEAPGQAEEERGIPLIGPSGRLFNSVLHNTGIQRGGLWIANTVECRPPDNDIHCPEGVEAVDCCRSGLREELALMRESGVKVIVAMGETAARALGLEGKLSKIRGSVYEIDGFHVVATYHPAFLLRTGGKRGDQGVNLLGAFTSDMQKVRDIAEKGFTFAREEFNLEPSRGDVDEFVDDALREKRHVAVDIETTGLHVRKGAKVVCVGLATSASKALVVPLLTKDGYEYWSKEDYAHVKAKLEQLFEAGRLYFQNCFFDIPFLMLSGWWISIDDVEHDTLILHSLVSPETEHNLGYIVSIYGKTPEWKESFKNRDVPILQMDQLEMRRYNARDCVVLHQVMGPMLEQLREYGLEAFYEEETRPLMKPFMEMTLTGVGFDAKHLAKFKEKIDELVEAKQREIRDAYGLPEAFNFDSDDELRWLLFRQRPNKFNMLKSVLVTYDKMLKNGPKRTTQLIVGYDTTDVPLDLLPDEPIIDKQVVRTLDYKRPDSEQYRMLWNMQFVANIRELYQLKGFRGMSTDGGKIKVSNEGLLSYRIQLQNRLSVVDGLKTPKQDEVDAIMDVLSLIEMLGEQSTLSKLATAFTNYEPSPDGRIHPSWLMHGTATGRLSCKSPNLNQLPSKGDGAEVRKFFTAPVGYKIIDADKRMFA